MKVGFESAEAELEKSYENLKAKFKDYAAINRNGPSNGGCVYQAEFVGIYLPKTWAVVERLQMALSFSGPPRVRQYGRPSRPTWLPHK